MGLFKEVENLIFAIDFDGTIVANRFPDIGEFKIGAKEVINNLYDMGHTIIIWTCRYGRDIMPMREALDKEGIKYHKINENADSINFKPIPKVYADVYIDDKALGGIPENWYAIQNLLVAQGVIK